MRGEIKRKLLTTRFGDEARGLIREGSAFADEFYNRCFSKKEQELMTSLPKGWLIFSHSIHATFGGQYRTLNFSGRHYFEWLKLASKEDEEWGARDWNRLIPSNYNTSSGGPRARLLGDDPLVAKYEKLEQAKKNLQARINEAANLTGQMLNSATTLKRLQEVWPDIVPFTADIADENGVPRIALPSVSLASLNQMLGLPVPDTNKIAA